MTLYEEQSQEDIARERLLHSDEQQHADGLSLNKTDKPAKLADTMGKRFKSIRYQHSRFGKRWNGYTNKVGW